MPKIIRSAKGQMIDIDRMKIEQQIKSVEKPISIDLQPDQKNRNRRLQKVRRAAKKVISGE